MKRFILTFAIIALITSCKTQRFTVHDAQCTVIKDSVSITYKQGVEQPASPDAIGAQTDFRKNSSAPALGKVGLGATREAAVFEEVQSARTKKKAVPPTPIIRVDTVFIERWHTQTISEPTSPPPSGGGREGASKFYRHCTIGFWLLLLLLFGRIAFRIFKAIYLRK